MAHRLAWFTPLPPVRSGISAYSTDVLTRLSCEFAIDVFVDDGVPHGTGDRPDARTGTVVLRAHDFVTRHALAPYDLVVYQLGNATCHDYMWPYLLRYPGLVVLHDAGLHHSRARLLLAAGRTDHYRAEFRYAHPDAPSDTAEFAVAGLAGAPYYLWPLTRLALDGSRMVAVHSPGLARMLEESGSTVPVRVIRMGVPAPDEARRSASTAGRSTAGDAPLLLVCFGLVTPEKRIPQVLRAFAPIAAARPDARLALVGDTSPHYDVGADIGVLGLHSRVEVTGFVDDEHLDEWLTSADVCLCLRWPTARETSASWLRCLAAGKATIVTDLVHTTEVPVLDPRSWTLVHTDARAAAANVPPTPWDAIAVAIDILDEDHSLGLALHGLAADLRLRRQLGVNARAFWAAGHTVAHMAADYRDVIAEALALPTPAPPSRPAHLTDDGTDTARSIAGEMGVVIPW